MRQSVFEEGMLRNQTSTKNICIIKLFPYDSDVNDLTHRRNFLQRQQTGGGTILNRSGEKKERKF